jgi:DNA-binding MarR family transcriptional regulator
MDQTKVLEQAKTMAELLPTLMRQLTAGGRDPAADMPLAQLKVCGILFHGPQPMSALSRDLGVSLSAMTQIADRMERAELVHRVPQGGDRRIRCLQLTDHGEKMIRLREEARAERLLAVLKHIAPPAREEVLVALQTLIRACVATRDGDGVSPKQHGSRLSTSKVLL